jgi:UDP-N-acetylmuramoyl-L-alanyl-D-glutamate--2,6-diaminopimelate ligase
MKKTLKTILNKLKINHTINKNINILGIENDSRKVKPGYIYVAVVGYKTDGHKYIDSAIQNGAVCVFVEDENHSLINTTSIPVIPYNNTRKALAHLTKIFYDNPSKHLKLIGVTGTNGKTSITYMLKYILESKGEKVGLIGTICNYIGDKQLNSSVTTPDSLELNRLLNLMVVDNVNYVIMEVSSHALFLDRVYGLNFDSIVFTNITEDHLDFHNTMEEYLKVKESAFDLLSQSEKTKKLAVINNDLLVSKRLIQKVNDLGLNYVTYGINNQSDYMAVDINFTISNSSFRVENTSKHFNLNIPLPGKFNIYNTLASFAVAMSFGIDDKSILLGLKGVLIPGRFQLIKTPIDSFVIIDYAHTDDALKNVLTTIVELSPRRVISVFGAGGDRDKDKRYLMGLVAGELSDLSIVTSDNPRTENPHRILDDIIIGINKVSGSYIKIADRYNAIKKAITLSKNGDIVLIAGKGHEDYQIFKDKTIHFDDKEVSEEVIRDIWTS